MKTKLIKCLICNHWRLKLENDHCSICGAHKLSLGHGRIMHVNNKGVELVKGNPNRFHLTEDNRLEIARVLAED